MAKIRFLVTQEALERKFTVRELIGMQEGNLRVIATTLSRFVANGHGVMEQKKAFELICDLNETEMEEAMADFKAAKEAAILPPKGADS